MTRTIGALLVVSLAACVNAADDDAAGVSAVEQATSQDVCESRLDSCEASATRRYDACTYGVELDYDYCERNHGVNCYDTYQTAWLACGDRADSDRRRCERNYCFCMGGTTGDCAPDIG